MNNKTLRYILGRRPSLISLPVYGGDGEGVSKLVANVMDLGVTQKQLRIMATKTPGVLSTPPNNVIKVSQKRKPKPNTLNPKPCKWKPRPNTLNPEPCKWKPRPNTLNPEPCKLLLNREPQEQKSKPF